MPNGSLVIQPFGKNRNEVHFMDSILTSIKKLLGITEDCDSFDGDLILHINTVLAALNQLGVGNDFSITGDKETWTELLGNDSRLNLVKSYVHLRVKSLFDPPLSSSVSDSIERNIKELEWRILVVADTV